MVLLLFGVPLVVVVCGGGICCLCCFGGCGVPWVGVFRCFSVFVWVIVFCRLSSVGYGVLWGVVYCWRLCSFDCGAL